MSEWLAKITANDSERNGQIEFILDLDGNWHSSDDLEDIVDALNNLFPVTDRSPALGKAGGLAASRASKWLGEFAALSEVQLVFPATKEKEKEIVY